MHGTIFRVMKMISEKLAGMVALLTEKLCCFCVKLRLVLFPSLYYNYIVHLGSCFPAVCPKDGLLQSDI